MFVDTDVFFKGKDVLMDAILNGYKLITNTIVIYEFMSALDERMMEERNEGRRRIYHMLKNRFFQLLRELGIEVCSTELRPEDLKLCNEIMKEKGIDIGDAIIYVFMHKRNMKKILTFDDEWRKFADIEIVR